MTENLADFLRLTLALDPQQLISLDEEIQLQKPTSISSRSGFRTG